MSEHLKRLRERRSLAVAKMREITDLAQNEGRDLTAEEVQKHDTIYGEVENLRQQIVVAERQQEIDRSMATLAAEQQEQNQRNSNGGNSIEERQMVAFRRYLQTGSRGAFLLIRGDLCLSK